MFKVFKIKRNASETFYIAGAINMAVKIINVYNGQVELGLTLPKGYYILDETKLPVKALKVATRNNKHEQRNTETIISPRKKNTRAKV